MRKMFYAPTGDSLFISLRQPWLLIGPHAHLGKGRVPTTTHKDIQDKSPWIGTITLSQSLLLILIKSVCVSWATARPQQLSKTKINERGGPAAGKLETSLRRVHGAECHTQNQKTGHPKMRDGRKCTLKAGIPSISAQWNQKEQKGGFLNFQRLQMNTKSYIVVLKNRCYLLLRILYFYGQFFKLFMHFKVMLEHNPRQVCSKVSPIVFNGTSSKESVFRIAAVAALSVLQAAYK